MRRITSIRRAQKLVGRISFILVMTLGFFSVVSILTRPNVKSFADMNSESVTGSRTPAAIPSQINFDSRSKSNVLRLSCSSKNEFEVSDSQIRLKGSLCLDDKSVDEILNTQIQNSLNEDVATVFHKNSLFTTDIIHLDKGRNELTITHHLSNGKLKVQRIVVNKN